MGRISLKTFRDKYKKKDSVAFCIQAFLQVALVDLDLSVRAMQSLRLIVVAMVMSFTAVSAANSTTTMTTTSGGFADASSGNMVAPTFAAVVAWCVNVLLLLTENLRQGAVHMFLW